MQAARVEVAATVAAVSGKCWQTNVTHLLLCLSHTGLCEGMVSIGNKGKERGLAAAGLARGCASVHLLQQGSNPGLQTAVGIWQLDFIGADALRW